MDRLEAEGLKPYATARQAEMIAAVISHGSQVAAADAMGVNLRTLERHLAAVRRKAARQGYAPDHDMVHTAPDGFGVKGVSTLYTHGEDGQKVAAQWVKTARDSDDRMRLLQDLVERMVEGLPAQPPIAEPKPQRSELMAAYVMGDPHIGMYAWHEEAGEDFDLEIACQQLYAATDALVSSAPDCDEAIIANLGDFYHADTPENRTKRSQNSLDVDGRHGKVFRAGWAVMQRCINRALEKHKKVTVHITKGNHDEESSFALAEVLRALYRDEPRVEIIGGIAYRHYHRFGKVLIGITHGDKAKPNDLSGIMAAERSEDWGETTCRRWFVGHFHHQMRKEFPGCIVEIFPTLAAKDAWHSSMGYVSERAMNCVIFHIDGRETGRRIEGVQPS